MKQKRQIGILVILVSVAALVWAVNFRSKAVTADASPSPQDPPPLIEVTNPHIRMEEIKRTQGAEYKGSGRNPFSYGAAAPVAPKTAQPKRPSEFYGPKLPPPPPPPPPCVLPANVKFYGYGSVNGASRRAFFTDEEGAVQIVGEGDVLLKRFRIIRISNANLEFEEISRGCVGTAPMEEQAPSPQP